MEVLWQILEGVSGGGYGKTKKMLKVADYLEQLHTETLPLSEKDPERALGVYINIYRTLLMVNAMSVGFNQKAAKRLHSLLMAQTDHVKKILLKHPPEDVPSFAVDFLNLPLYGLPCLSWLDTLSEVWGPEEMKAMRLQVEGALQRGDCFEGTPVLFSVGGVIGSITPEEMIQMYPDLFLLFEGKVEAFIKTQLPSGEVRSYKSLSALADKLCEMGIFRGALACLQSISAPKPCPESEGWYLTCDFLMRDVGLLEESRELRWKFFLARKDTEALELYIRPWLKDDGSLPEDPEYFQAARRIKKHIIEKCDLKKSLDICFEWSNFHGFEDILDELMIYHYPRFSNYSTKIFELVVQKIDQDVKEGKNNLFFIAILLAHRELIRRSWKSHYNPNPEAFLMSAVPHKVTSQEVFVYLSSDLEKLGIRLKLVQGLGAELKTSLLQRNLPSHEEFVKSLSRKKSSKYGAYDRTKRPSLPF